MNIVHGSMLLPYGPCVIMIKITVYFPPLIIGACPDLPDFSGGSISYDFEFFSEINGRPYGTVATYMCDAGSITGEPTRTCENGVWSGSEPSCRAASK